MILLVDEFQLCLLEMNFSIRMFLIEFSNDVLLGSTTDLNQSGGASVLDRLACV